MKHLLNKSYPILSCSQHDIRKELRETLSVDIFDPVTRKEELLAEAMGEFSSFVLDQEPVMCQAILDADGGRTVGELQGGNDQYAIYRISLPDNIDIEEQQQQQEEECGNNGCSAAVKLLQAFYASHQGKRYRNIFTLEKLRQYMLGMCHRRAVQERNCSDKKCNYTRLGNFMFILQFGGPTLGQVRHIDAMLPNLQICLYMSHNCPTTILYDMEGEEPITNGEGLVHHWMVQEGRKVPPMVALILREYGNIPLETLWYLKYFSFWRSINSQLYCFGKLYQSVRYQHSCVVSPGTTLLAGGNEVHAGPPTDGARMFAFAIGIPEDDEVDDDNDDNDDDNEGLIQSNMEHGENDGEVQYSPVLFHIDMCCLFFTIMDYDSNIPNLWSSHSTCVEKPLQSSSNSLDDAIQDGKMFLMELLMELIQDYPMKAYLQQIQQDRKGLIHWLERALQHIVSEEDNLKYNGMNVELLRDALESDDIFYSPDVMTRKKRLKKGKRRMHIKKGKENV